MVNVDRMPPFDVGAEQGILGCVMLDPQGSIPEIAARGEDLFYDLRHQVIFEAARELLDARKPVDCVTLMAQLSRKQKLDSVGGVAYLASLPDAVPSAANLPYYLEIALECSTRRKIIQVGTTAVNRAYETEKDAMALLDETEQALGAISKGLVGDTGVSTPELLNRAMESLERAYKRGKELEGIKTGFPKFDRMTAGLQNGDMIVIAARPSIGKTSLAMNIAEYVSTDLNEPVGVFSLEMTAESLMRRMLCSRAGINERNVRAQNVSEQDFSQLISATARLKEANLFIDDTAGLSVMQLRAKARRMSRQHGIKLLVIDYLQLLQAVTTTRREINRQQEIANISNGVKALAKELNIPIVVLSQLNREIDRETKRRPRLSDLRESGAIEQDADVIAMLYRTEEDPDSTVVIPVNMLIAKQRNGPTGDVSFTFDKAITRFKEVSDFD